MELIVESIHLSKLVENKGQIEGVPRNPRLIKDGRFKKLIESLLEHPEMLQLKELWVYPQNNHFVVISGNMRLKALRALKMKLAPCKILPADTPSADLVAYALKDNVLYGENDLDILANEYDVDDLERFGVETPDLSAITKPVEEKDDDEQDDDADFKEDKEEFYKSMLNDCLYESNNMFDIPVLQPLQMAGKLTLPFAPWGADSRLRTDISTYHFYVDDYRFEALFKDPVKLLISGVKQVVEPNLSLFDITPIAYGLHQIYKKRWLARYFQEVGIKVYADLNVSKKFYEFNQLGIPQGWNAFFTRGYHDRVNYLLEEIEIAKKISGLDTPNLIVYGGGEKIKEVCVKNSLLYAEQFMNDR